MTTATPDAADSVQPLLRRWRIVPVVTIEDAARAVPLADALAEGGLPCAEITFRTPAAAEALRRVAAERPGLLAGAGTVLTVEQARQARDAGARFVVSPGLNPAVVEYCREHDLPVYPGACTPTEIETALRLGLTLLKFFPAEAAGGVPFLRAVGAPYPMVSFMPTGGIGPSNLGAYFALPNVAACGGTWMAPSEWIAAGDFARVREAARAAAALARERAEAT